MNWRLRWKLWRAGRTLQRLKAELRKLAPDATVAEAARAQRYLTALELNIDELRERIQGSDIAHPVRGVDSLGGKKTRP
jgi:hypothetical protein